MDRMRRLVPSVVVFGEWRGGFYPGFTRFQRPLSRQSPTYGGGDHRPATPGRCVSCVMWPGAPQEAAVLRPSRTVANHTPIDLQGY